MDYSFGWLVAIVLAVFLAPIWIALKAKPLGRIPYRWATWLAVESFLLALLVAIRIAPTVTNRGIDTGSLLILLSALLCLLAAVGLFRRMRAGVVFGIASEVFFILLDPLVSALYQTKSGRLPGSPIPILVLIIANVFYFKKRWGGMASGLLVPRHKKTEIPV